MVPPLHIHVCTYVPYIGIRYSMHKQKYAKLHPYLSKFIY
jgi:hypothetical protein